MQFLTGCFRLGVSLLALAVPGVRAARVLPLCAPLLLLAVAAGAGAEIAVDATASGGTSGAGVPTGSWSHTVGTGSNRILVVGVTGAAAVTYGGQPLTRHIVNSELGFPTVEIWTLLAPPTGPALVAVTYPQLGVFVGGSVSFFGVDQATPIRASGQARARTLGPLAQIAINVTSQPGDVVLDTVAVSDTVSPGGAPAAGQTLQWRVMVAGAFLAASTKPGDAGSTSLTWTFGGHAGRHAALAAISLRPAPTPQQLIEEVMATVLSFALHHGLENALLAKLDAALGALDAGDPARASHSLDAFIHQVEAQSGKGLTTAQADALLAAADDCLAALE